MKTLKFLSIAAMFAALVCSCDDDETEPSGGTVTGYPAPEVTLKDCGDSYIALSWTAVDKVESYTAQLLDMGEAVGHEETVDGTEITFDGLNAGSAWYARVRSDFSGDHHSDWAYVTDSGSNAVIVVGQGIADVSPSISLVGSSASTLTFGWGFSGDDAADVGGEYEVCLYSDESCSDLVVGWTVGADSGIFCADAGCRFTFSGLEPSTAYYCEVRSLTFQGLSTGAMAGTTSAATDLSGAVASADFSALYHGGDPSLFAAGYTIGGDQRSSNVKAAGMDQSGCSPIPYDTDEFDVFGGDGVTSGYIEGAGLSGWAHSGTTVGCPGYLRLGSAGESGALWTPELTSLDASGSNVYVTLSAKAFSPSLDLSDADSGLIVVSAVSGASVSGNAASGGTVLCEADPVTAPSNAFGTFTTPLYGVTAGSRICIATSDGRALLDDVAVTYVGPSSTEPLAAPSNAAFDELATGSTKATFTWDAVNNASSYTVRYWKDGSESSAQEIADITDCSCTIEGLSPLTTYWAQVMACDFNPDFNSQYSDAASTTTLEQQGIFIDVLGTSCSTISIHWNVNGLDEANTAKYRFEAGVYTSSECVEETLYVGWTFDDTTLWYAANADNYHVGFTFTGLSEGTTYYVMIYAIDEAGNLYDDTLVSETLAVRTTTFDHVVTAVDEGTAQVGDVIVANSFKGLVHGGDGAFHCCGCTTSASRYRDEYRVPVGHNPDYLIPCGWNAGTFNFFSGSRVTADYTAGCGFSDWCEGNSAGAAGRAGFAKVGGSGSYGYLATPQLTAIPEGKTATVRVDFQAKAYTLNNDSGNVTSHCRGIQVGVVNDVTVVDYQVSGWESSSDNVVFEDSAIAPITDLATTEDNRFWAYYFPIEDCSVTLHNVTNRSRIRFGIDTQTYSASDNHTRFYLREVVITVLDLE